MVAKNKGCPKKAERKNELGTISFKACVKRSEIPPNGTWEEGPQMKPGFPNFSAQNKFLSRNPIGRRRRME